MNRTYWEMWSKVKPNKTGFGIKEGKERDRDQAQLAIYAERKKALPKVIRRRPEPTLKMIWSDTEQWATLMARRAA